MVWREKGEDGSPSVVIRCKDSGGNISLISFDTSLSKVMIFGGLTLFTHGMKYTIHEEDSLDSIFSNNLNKMFPKIEFDDDEVIIGFEIASETVAYFLTNKGTIVGVWSTSKTLKCEDVDHCVIHRPAHKCAATENMCVVHFARPKALKAFRNRDITPFLEITDENLLKFAENAGISLYDERFVVLNDASQVRLLDMTTKEVREIPIKAEKLHFEHPYFHALNKLTYTKYDMHGHPLETYTFHGFKLVVPNKRITEFALYPSTVVKNFGLIRFVSRTSDYEL